MDGLQAEINRTAQADPIRPDPDRQYVYVRALRSLALFCLLPIAWKSLVRPPLGSLAHSAAPVLRLSILLGDCL
jgi:hypothetical protein